MRTATLADIAALIQALALLLFGIGAVTIAPGLRIFLASAAKRRTSISPASALRIVAAQFVRGAVQAKVAESSVTVARCSEEVVRCADQSDRSTFVPDDPRPRRSRFSAALTWAFFGIPGIIAFRHNQGLGRPVKYRWMDAVPRGRPRAGVYLVPIRGRIRTLGRNLRNAHGSL